MPKLHIGKTKGGNIKFCLYKTLVFIIINKLQTLLVFTLCNKHTTLNLQYSS